MDPQHRFVISISGDAPERVRGAGQAAQPRGPPHGRLHHLRHERHLCPHKSQEGILFDSQINVGVPLLTLAVGLSGSRVVDPDPAFQVNPDPDTDPGF